MYKIGIDIGGTKITFGLFDVATKQLVETSKLQVKNVNDLLGAVVQQVTLLSSKAGCSMAEVCSVGVGIPGTVSEDGKRVVKAPNMPLLTEDFATQLQKILGLPVTLLQDSRAAAWGECVAGGGVGCNCVVCVTLGTGIGTGIVLNGQIYNGALGCAGELGHIPVEQNGRPCGCGKEGCLEKYCAGGGLDVTARQLFGSNATAHQLFEAASQGEESALQAIGGAVQTLGKGIVAIVNLLSPDCILFSGGLSEQQQLYLQPLMDYVATHCYNAGALPKLAKATLGELSPLFGAAFAPNVGAVAKLQRNKNHYLSASIMCGDMLHLAGTLRQLEEAGVDMIHCDVMDNHFVPNLMLPMELLNKMRLATVLPMDFHLMTYNPQNILDKLDVRSGDFVSVHVESTPDVQSVLCNVKQRGAKAAIALNPNTSIAQVEHLLPLVDMVLVMTVHPGFAGQKMVEGSLQKIQQLRNMLQLKGLNHVLVQVDGNCSFENIPKMMASGANVFVGGTSSIFHKDGSVLDNVIKLNNLLEKTK